MNSRAEPPPPSQLADPVLAALVASEKPDKPIRETNPGTLLLWTFGGFLYGLLPYADSRKPEDYCFFGSNTDQAWRDAFKLAGAQKLKLEITSVPPLLFCYQC